MSEHRRRNEFLGQPTPEGDIEERRPIITARMFLQEQRVKQAEELKRKYAFSNMTIAANGNWYPDEMLGDVEEMAFNDEFVRRPE